MNIAVITIIIVISIGTLLFGKSGGELPTPFRNRSCQGRGWKRNFPQTQIKDIREFLHFFVAAFAFSDKEKLKLNPNDRILEIYKALYPSKWMADALEFETLATGLQQIYAVELAKIWKDDLTLGDLFIECQKARHNTR